MNLTLEKFKELYENDLKKDNFDHFIDPKILHLDHGKAVIQWTPRTAHLNRFQTVHGGAFSGLVDSVGAIATLSTLKRVVTIEMQVSYLKPGKIDSVITATGKVISEGRSLIRTEVEIKDQHDDLLVKGHLTFFVLGDLVL
jgi:acyl-CoA thioesterase